MPQPNDAASKNAKHNNKIMAIIIKPKTINYIVAKIFIKTLPILSVDLDSNTIN